MNIRENCVFRLETSMGKVAYPICPARGDSDSREQFLRALRRLTVGTGLPVAVFVLITLPFYPILVPKIFSAR
jgi:hypothetical protein